MQKDTLTRGACDKAKRCICAWQAWRLPGCHSERLTSPEVGQTCHGHETLEANVKAWDLSVAISIPLPEGRARHGWPLRMVNMVLIVLDYGWQLRHMKRLGTGSYIE